MSALAYRPKRTYRRGKIACRKCGAPIYIHKLAALPEEFSVQCSKCHSRSLYPSRAMTLEELPERRRKPRD